MISDKIEKHISNIFYDQNYILYKFLVFNGLAPMRSYGLSHTSIAMFSKEGRDKHICNMVNILPKFILFDIYQGHLQSIKFN